MRSTITAKGQTTIPKPIREHLKLQPGGSVKYFIHPDGHVVLLPTLPITALKGFLNARGKHVTLDQMDAAITEGATRRWRRLNDK
jgi:antitoxin PrlF